MLGRILKIFGPSCYCSVFTYNYIDHSKRCSFKYILLKSEVSLNICFPASARDPREIFVKNCIIVFRHDLLLLFMMLWSHISLIFLCSFSFFSPGLLCSF